MDGTIVANPWEKWKADRFDQVPIWAMHIWEGKLEEKTCSGCKFLRQIERRDPYNRRVNYVLLRCDVYRSRTLKAANWREDFQACRMWSDEKDPFFYENDGV